jgi:hypothetical protein
MPFVCQINVALCLARTVPVAPTKACKSPCSAGTVSNKGASSPPAVEKATNNKITATTPIMIHVRRENREKNSFMYSPPKGFKASQFSQTYV